MKKQEKIEKFLIFFGVTIVAIFLVFLRIKIFQDSLAYQKSAWQNFLSSWQKVFSRSNF